MERDALLDDLKPILQEKDMLSNSKTEVHDKKDFRQDVPTQNIHSNINTITMEEVVQVDKNKKVEAVKNEIASLDANINKLKHKLESAAMSQTQNIVSDILRKQMQ